MLQRDCFESLFVKGDILYTPSLKTGILNGITRAFIIKVAEKMGIEVKEGLFTKMNYFQPMKSS